MKHLCDTTALDLDLNEIEICFNELAKGNVPAALVDSIECACEELDSKYERLKTNIVSSQSIGVTLL